VSAFALILSMNWSLAQAPQPATDYTPEVGQEGKDVVWVPTPQTLVDKMLDMAKVTPEDYVVDLGSGDGRTVITAAKRGAKAHGIEYNPDLVALSKRNAEKEGVTDKATFEQADIFKSDFSQATVVTLFLLNSLNLQLRPTILNMKPGTRVVSNTFDMGDWKPDNTVSAPSDCISYCKAFFWVVPAKVEGTWKLPQGELALKQQYQMITGTLKTGKRTTPIKGKVVGSQVTFTGRGTEYRGEVSGATIDLSSKAGKLRATRAGA
jgi:SAM-dependent methyltransferase